AEPRVLVRADGRDAQGPVRLDVVLAGDTQRVATAGSRRRAGRGGKESEPRNDGEASGHRAETRGHELQESAALVRGIDCHSGERRITRGSFGRQGNLAR